MRTAMCFLVTGFVFSSATAHADDKAKIVSTKYVGHTQSPAVVHVRARVTGYVTDVYVKEGQTVKQGDLLIAIDPRPYELALEAAQAQVKMAQAELAAEQIHFANIKRMYEKHVVNEQKLKLAQAEMDQAEAALDGAQAERKQAQLAVGWASVEAPIKGRASQLQVTKGDVVVANRTPILNVIATNSLHVVFYVPESRFLRMRREGLCNPDAIDLAVQFAGEKGYPHEAKLIRVAPTVIPVNGTVQFVARVPNPKRLLMPGMSAEVRLTVAPEKE